MNIRKARLYEKYPPPNPRGEDRGAHVPSSNLCQQSVYANNRTKSGVQFVDICYKSYGVHRERVFSNLTKYDLALCLDKILDSPRPKDMIELSSSLTQYNIFVVSTSRIKQMRYIHLLNLKLQYYF